MTDAPDPKPRKASSDTDARMLEDRRWTLVGTAIVGGFLAFSVFVAFVALPAVQAPAAGIDIWSAMCRAVGISPGVPGWRQPASAAVAQPVSQVAWSPEVLDIIGRADPRPGAALAAQVCSVCHGEQGFSLSPAFPHLAGQSAAAIYKQLSDYRSGARVHPQMTPFARQLTEAQLAEVAAYFSGGNFSGILGDSTELPDTATAELVHRGDPTRGIPGCNTCHGVGVGGPIETPTLTGQHRQYLAVQLRAYRSGERRNDVYRRMREISLALTDEEIDRLAAFYQGLR
jgi:cytochrome c553